MILCIGFFLFFHLSKMKILGKNCEMEWQSKKRANVISDNLKQTVKSLAGTMHFNIFHKKISFCQKTQLKLVKPSHRKVILTKFDSIFRYIHTTEFCILNLLLDSLTLNFLCFDSQFRVRKWAGEATFSIRIKHGPKKVYRLSVC